MRSGSCKHEGFHSPSSQLLRDRKILRFFLVCDACGHVQTFLLNFARHREWWDGER